MMVIELRKAHKEKAFDLIDDLKELGHKKKAMICELEDILYKCFESSEEDYDDEYEEERRGREFGLRGRRSYRRGMRSHYREEDYPSAEMHNEYPTHEYGTRRVR